MEVPIPVVWRLILLISAPLESEDDNNSSCLIQAEGHPLWHLIQVLRLGSCIPTKFIRAMKSDQHRSIIHFVIELPEAWLFFLQLFQLDAPARLWVMDCISLDLLIHSFLHSFKNLSGPSEMNIVIQSKACNNQPYLRVICRRLSHISARQSTCT